jgi:drug/metabolite transporter (DMT)-like permease
VFLAEPIGWTTVIAGAAIVVAVVLIVTARPPKARAVPAQAAEPLRAAA